MSFLRDRISTAILLFGFVTSWVPASVGQGLDSLDKLVMHCEGASHLATQGPKFDCEATVTFVFPQWRLLYVQDGNRAYPLTTTRTGIKGPAIRFGDRVRIAGEVGTSANKRIVEPAIVQRIDPTAPIVPQQVDAERKGGHAALSRLVKSTGTVCTVVTQDDWSGLLMNKAGDSFWTLIPATDKEEKLVDLIGCHVEVIGAFGKQMSPRGEYEISTLYCQSRSNIKILSHASPEFPKITDEPREITLEELAQEVDSLKGIAVKTKALVVGKSHNHAIFITDGISTATIPVPMTEWVHAGQNITLVGTPLRSGKSLVLEPRLIELPGYAEAESRSKRIPPPLVRDVISEADDGRSIATSGSVISINTFDNRTTIALRQGSKTIAAITSAMVDQRIIDQGIAPGSGARVTGICSIARDNFLSGQSDIEIYFESAEALTAASPDRATAPSSLTTIAKVKTTRAEGPISNPFDYEIRGIVTFYSQPMGTLIVQDNQDALAINTEFLERTPRELPTGTQVTLAGRFSPGSGVLAMCPSKLSVGERTQPPEATKTSAGNPFLSDLLNQRVQMAGQLSESYSDRDVTLLALDDDGHRFFALVNEPHDSWKPPIGSVLNLTGVLSHTRSYRHDEKKHCVMIQDVEDITGFDTKANDTNYTVFQSIADVPLSKKGRENMAIVAVGQVSGIVDNQWVFLADVRGQIRVKSRLAGHIRDQNASQPLRVSVAGVVRREDGIPFVEARTITRLGPAITEIKPLAIDPRRVGPGNDAQLISVQGQVKSVLRNPTGTSISMSGGGRDFLVRIETPDHLNKVRFHESKPAAILVNGLCVVPPANENSSHDFVVYTASPNAITEVTQVALTPSKWGIGVLLSLLALVGIATAWAWILRGRVSSQTQSVAEITSQLRSAYDSIRDAIIVFDADGRLIASNEPFVNFFRFQPNDGSTHTEVGNELVRMVQNSQPLLRAWRRCSPNSMHHEALQISSSDGSHVWNAQSNPVVNGDQVIGRLWTFQDQSEELRLQTSLIQSQKMEAVGRLAGGIAHDFNNLLTGVIANLDVATMSVRDEDLETAHSSIDSAGNAAQRASQLVRNLLTFSRKSPLNPKVLSANRVLDQLHELLRPTMPASVNFETTMSDDLWFAEIDPVRLEQVFLNLYVNARDAIGESGGTIWTTTRNLVENDGSEYVVVTIRDDGCGMPHAVRKNAFEPFFTTKDQGEGTGLGLAMSYGIIEQHGGRILCDSQLGVGTTFSVLLPRSKQQALSPKPPTSELSIAPDIDGACVMVIDDEELVRKVATAMLELSNVRVIAADGGSKALQLLDESSSLPDLIVLDLTMPKMNGKETFKLIRQRFPDLPVIISSGHPTDLDQFSAEVGSRPNAFIPKPFNRADFLSEIDDILQQKSFSNIQTRNV